MSCLRAPFSGQLPIGLLKQAVKVSVVMKATGGAQGYVYQSCSIPVPHRPPSRVVARSISAAMPRYRHRLCPPSALASCMLIAQGLCMLPRYAGPVPLCTMISPKLTLFLVQAGKQGTDVTTIISLLASSN